MAEPNLALIGSAALGAVAQEVLWLYNLRRSMDTSERRVLMSRGYWAAMVVWVIFACLVSIVWFEGATDVRWKEAFLLGVGLPLIVKPLLKPAVPGLRLGLEGDARPRFSLARYLRG